MDFDYPTTFSCWSHLWQREHYTPARSYFLFLLDIQQGEKGNSLLCSQVGALQLHSGQLHLGGSDVSHFQAWCIRNVQSAMFFLFPYLTTKLRRTSGELRSPTWEKTKAQDGRTLDTWVTTWRKTSQEDHSSWTVEWARKCSLCSVAESSGIICYSS